MSPPPPPLCALAFAYQGRLPARSLPPAPLPTLRRCNRDAEGYCPAIRSRRPPRHVRPKPAGHHRVQRLYAPVPLSSLPPPLCAHSHSYICTCVWAPDPGPSPPFQGTVAVCVIFVIASPADARLFSQCRAWAAAKTGTGSPFGRYGDRRLIFAFRCCEPLDTIRFEVTPSFPPARVFVCECACVHVSVRLGVCACACACVNAHVFMCVCDWGGVWVRLQNSMTMLHMCACVGVADKVKALLAVGHPCDVIDLVWCSVCLCVRVCACVS